MSWHTKNNRVKYGQTVYLKCVGKSGVLEPKFKGPFKVIRKFRNFNYLIKSILDKRKNL